MAALRATILRFSCSKIMTHIHPFMLFFIVFVVFGILPMFIRRRDGRPCIRRITGYGVAFCVVSLNLWFVTRFEDIQASFPNPHETNVFATPWLWVSALCVGITLLLVSFFTREGRRHDSTAA